MAETQAVKEAIWLKKFLAEALNQEQVTVVIHCDNQGAIALAKNNQFHARTKHIDIREKWVREAVAAKDVALEYIPTDLQLDDGLTKPLPKDKFNFFRAAIGVERVVGWRYGSVTCPRSGTKNPTTDDSVQDPRRGNDSASQTDL